MDPEPGLLPLEQAQRGPQLQQEGGIQTYGCLWCGDEAQGPQKECDPLGILGGFRGDAVDEFCGEGVRGWVEIRQCGRHPGSLVYNDPSEMQTTIPSSPFSISGL